MERNVKGWRAVSGSPDMEQMTGTWGRWRQGSATVYVTRQRGRIIAVQVVERDPSGEHAFAYDFAANERGVYSAVRFARKYGPRNR